MRRSSRSHRGALRIAAQTSARSFNSLPIVFALKRSGSVIA